MLAQRIFRFNIALIYILLLIGGTWVSYSVYQNGKSIQVVNQKLTSQQLPSLIEISQLRYWTVELERVLYERYATISAQAFDRRATEVKLVEAIERIQLSIQMLQSQYPSDSGVTLLQQIFIQIQQRANALDEALPPAPYDWDLARDELAKISQLGRNTIPILVRLTDKIKSQIEFSKKESDRQLDQMSIWVVSFSVLIIAVALWLGYYLRKQISQSRERQRLALFVETNPNPVASFSHTADLIFENVAWREKYSTQNSESVLACVLSEIDSMKKAHQDYAIRKANISGEIIELTIHWLAMINQYLVHIEDITQQEVARKELEYLAYHDPLTGLSNLKRLETDLEELINLGNQHKFYLFSVGIKRLQLVTTTHGHSVSDALINAIVIRLQNLVAELLPQFKVCRIYRFMGAKFEILLALKKGSLNFDQAVALLNKGLKRASQKPLETSFGQFYLSMQVGCASFPDNGLSGSQLIKNSSSALNEAQRNNLEGVNLFNHELAYREQKWLQLEHDLHQSNMDQEFHLVYQPKISIQTGRTVGAEALIRWVHPRLGQISPVEFIPVAEESGMLLELGDWIMASAIKQASEWATKMTTPLQVAVNVSPSQLLAVGFVDKILELLAQYQLAADLLEIEITEEVMVEDTRRCVEVMQQLKNAGVSIALDDFGTGYSSLAYLNSMPLTKLKIDRSFVTDIHINDNNLAIVRSIISLAKSLQIEVVAEGIETQNEAKVLLDLGCHQGQGFLYSKPLKADGFVSQFFTEAKINSPN